MSVMETSIALEEGSAFHDHDKRSMLDNEIGNALRSWSCRQCSAAHVGLRGQRLKY